MYFNALKADTKPDFEFVKYQTGLSANFIYSFLTDNGRRIECKLTYNCDLTKLYTYTSASMYAGEMKADYYSASLMFFATYRFQVCSLKRK